jgi:hypothetical protein
MLLPMVGEWWGPSSKEDPKSMDALVGGRGFLSWRLRGV